MISARTIAQGIIRLLELGISPQDVYQSFSLFIKQNHLHAMMPNIIHYLNMLEKNNHQQVEIVIAHDISETLISNIKLFINAEKKDPLVVIKNQEIIGGFIARHHNVEYDASIKTQLLKFKNAITTL